MAERGHSQIVFRKSTHSDAHGCVEVATLKGYRLIRDSQAPDGPVLSFSKAAWSDFLRDLKKLSGSPNNGDPVS